MNHLFNRIPLLHTANQQEITKLFCHAGGHRDQRGAGEFANEAGREWRGLFCEGNRERAGE